MTTDATIRVPWVAMPSGSALVVVTCEEVDLRPLGIDAVIPRGFVCDGMSIPAIFRPAMGQPVDAIATAAAVVHDYLYTCAAVRIDGKPVTRWQADAILRRMLIESGYGRWRSWAAWTGVRIGGGKHWHADA